MSRTHKYYTMADIADYTAGQVVKGKDEWTRYLDVAARLYKYPFQDQLLIYAQRPDATACAGIEVWNQKMNCWVNRGAKGIALLDDDTKRLRYVFDVSDVHKARYIGRDPYLWELKEEHQEKILERLEEIYGSTDETAPFAERLIEIADWIALDVSDDLMQELTYVTKGSYLEELDDLNLKVHFRSTLASSIAFTLLLRCGIDVEPYMEEFTFPYIHEFNSTLTLSQLGTAATELSKPILMEIGKTIRSYDREQERQEKLEKGVVNSPQKDYNALKRESKNAELDSDEQERGKEHESDISEERRLLHPEYNSERTGGQAVDEVRTDEEELSEGEQDGTVQRSDAEWAIDGAPSGSTGEGAEPDGAADERDGTKRGRDGRDKNGRPNVMGTQDEQHPEPGRGDGTLRRDLQLETETKLAGGDKQPALLSEETVRKILKADDYRKAKRVDIAEFFAGEPDGKLRAAYLEEHYNKEFSETVIDTERVGYKTDTEGLLMWQGGYLSREREIHCSWILISELIDSMILNNQFLSEGEVQEVGERLENKKYEQLRLFPSVEEQIGNIAVDNADQSFALPTAFSISDEVIDTILMTGGGRKYSRFRIFENYEKGKTPEERVAFLQKEYEQGGKGFLIDENPISVWYDKGGMHFANGNAARYSYELTLSWPEVGERIGSLIESGLYMDVIGAQQAEINEKKELASKVYFFFRDQIEGHWPEAFGEIYGAPDAMERIQDMLSTKEGLTLVIDKITEGVEKLESGEWERRWRLIHAPKDILADVSDLQLQPQKFPLMEDVHVLEEGFITQDEIDWRLCGGSLVSQGKTRIHDFFQGEHTKKELADFLKREYGTGGRSHALPGKDQSDEWHDAKGIRFSKGSLLDPEAKVLLKWNKVAERIRFLIDSDHYFTSEEKEEMELREEEQQLADLEEGKEEPKSQEIKTVVAIESTEDYTDYSVGFYTYHYQDGREGIRYRLVTVGADGLLTAYPEKTKFFINEEHIKDYIGEHEAELEVITYDEMIDQVDTKSIAQRETEEISEGKAEQSIESDAEELLTIEEETPEEELAPEPEPDISQAVNFHITDDALGQGTPKVKFRQNIEAIRLLQKIEMENRTATPEEQHILSQYAGWGGLPEVFDENNASWAVEYQELKSILDEHEYHAARSSTLNAHYTAPVIINAMYETLERMGFEKGSILEPSMGTGNFFGLLPEAMRESKLYGVELDSITGRMAKQLYPHANVQIKGFEETSYPNDFFDVVIGNVPFGQYKVHDKSYNKHNFLIHDYFIAKSLDKIRPGGIIAVVTTKGTMDKKNPAVRKYLAQRAELLGAVRLPNNAFKANAGTKVTSDILFLQKRDRVMDIEPDWVHLAENEDGIAMNQYFTEHPEMIAGKMELVSGPYGMEPTCSPIEGMPLEEQLREAMRNMTGVIESAGLDELEDDSDLTAIPADPDVRNYSYTVVDDTVYYRENSIMRPVEETGTMEERIKGMVAIRNCTHELIEYQLEEYGVHEIKEKQQELNKLYDAFYKRYGVINSVMNKKAFNQDSSYCLLCSLEVLNEDGTLKKKADMFTKRTIKKPEVVEAVDTSSEALTVSLNEKAGVDIAYMAHLTGKKEEEIITELAGVIFKNPITDMWETADEYLSGNVREKLQIARTFTENHPEFAVNVSALEQVQPKNLEASEIEVRLGANWIDHEYINDFMREVFETPKYHLNDGTIGVQYSTVSGTWNIRGKNADTGNVLTNMTYGTNRANAYKILEDALNLRDTQIWDKVYEDGKEKRVINKQETILAGQKQEAIREAFNDWIFQDVDRREKICEVYNEKFNATRPREYDGGHLTFPGMSPDITMEAHQKNAVAHQLYGDNTLLAHCVGAGKTFEMSAAAMELRRLGLAQKSLFVVPNHLIGQWASEFLSLYPGANLLAATKKDFEPANRKKFCSRISTGDYDGVIIGHSQFEKIPLSQERQAAMIERQMDELTIEIQQVKEEGGERYTIKQMEKTKKALEGRLARLNDQSRKDDVVTFEQLGVDRLFVDESHNYKNLFIYTKMRNIAGIAQTEAQKSSDMFAKCQYMDELTGGKGITFATGTPISNSMTELYTNMRYLQYQRLQELGLGHFDNWAASFGETVTAVELSPEGTGYRAKKRFARFFNLPELISLFKESADIQTADMLKLPVPEADYEDVVLKPSEHQKALVASLAERAEMVRNRRVEPNIDNMLKITTDGRKLALDQRLINDMLPEEKNSKVQACVDRAHELWQEYREEKGAQLIFCDSSTPRKDGTFNVYDEIKKKLMEKGVPEEEIAFIHDANTDTKKTNLFAKVRSGQVRFLLGSTTKMGAGTNVQDRLIALHHLDVPWRPSDIEQQEGRILRKGNRFKKVKIFRYITEGTFDAYSWQLIENKQRFISQIMTSKSPVRSAEDIDESALSYAEVKALATGNVHIKEKMDLDIQVSKLKLLKSNHTSQIYRLQDNIAKHYPQQINALKERMAGYETDMARYQRHKPVSKEVFAIQVGNQTFTDRKEGGTALIAHCKKVKLPNISIKVGEYLGFPLAVTYDVFHQVFRLETKGALTHSIEMGSDVFGNLKKMDNLFEGMEKRKSECEVQLDNLQKQLENAKNEVQKPFGQEMELTEKLERLSELNALLNMDEKGEGSMDSKSRGEASVADKPAHKKTIRERLADYKAEIGRKDGYECTHAGKEKIESL